MGLVLPLVETRTDSEMRSAAVVEITRPGDIQDITNLVLTLPEAKQLRARTQRAVVDAHARDHAALCLPPRQGMAPSPNSDAVQQGDGAAIRFLCPGCGHSESGVAWPAHCRSTPELDQLHAHSSALIDLPHRCWRAGTPAAGRGRDEPWTL